MTAAIDALLQRRGTLRSAIVHLTAAATESVADAERSNAAAAETRAQLAEIERAIVALGGKIPRAEEELKPR